MRELALPPRACSSIEYHAELTAATRLDLMCPPPPPLAWRLRATGAHRAHAALLHCTAGAQAMQKNKERVAQTFRAAFAAK